MRILFCLLAIGALVKNSTAQEKSWYGFLEGRIGPYPITMHLYKTGHSYTGYYYYNTSQVPFPLSGNDSATGAGDMLLMAYAPGIGVDEAETFRLKGNRKDLYGSWQKSTGAKKLNVSLKSIDSVAPAFDYIYSTGTKILRPGMNESPEASYEAAAVWPKNNEAVDVFLKKLIRAKFGAANSKETIGTIFQQERNKSFGKYLQSFKNEPDSNLLATRFSYSQEESSTFHIVWRSKKLISFAFFNYAYTGGAHGNYATAYTVIDVVAAKTLKKEDIFSGSWQKPLNALLEKKFRFAYGLQPGDSLSEKGGLFENKIEANDNFYITSMGICFNYAPYEIGPYVMGEITVFVPFAELKSFLKPAFKKMLE